MMEKKVLVVCMGNICRSPTAEVVLRTKAKERDIPLIVDSAGTLGYHQGEKPDPRSRAAGEARGYRFDGVKARKVIDDDFEYFDLVLAADRDNLQALMAMCPEAHQHKLALFLDYGDGTTAEIPDPYYGGQRGFDHVLDLVEQASDGLLTHLTQ
ncbi:low molecular weight protein-tyrosine-phosphatase [Photobacterium aphoticum]|uniref:protein-tyrosine-phosphatase n=1 Tax=Photobacterium aphoticum TaxID=754436 RepID=A0A0J1GTI7_9GAMM|nr:low molecular weight protein-tyrosine-phosphatase [Photobacterium aphoticum]KLV02981.1 protein tyrosine phosphatase [Photobacterium aphoticum]GHA60228.1 protein-tyrosine-phosphatase [Photobacterium aphoticum]